MIKKAICLTFGLGLLVANENSAVASEALAGQVFPVNQSVCMKKSAKMHVSSSRSSRVIAQLSAGEKHRATGKTGDRRWFRVKAKGKTGFVKRSAVKTC